MLKRIYIKTAIALVPLIVISTFFEPKRLPLGIFAGGVFALLNLRAMAWGLSGMLGSDRATAKLIVFGILRMTLLFIAITSLVVLKIVSIFGLLIGFTIVFTILLVEGTIASKESQ